MIQLTPSLQSMVQNREISLADAYTIMGLEPPFTHGTSAHVLGGGSGYANQWQQPVGAVNQVSKLIESTPVTPNQVDGVWRMYAFCLFFLSLSPAGAWHAHTS